MPINMAWLCSNVQREIPCNIGYIYIYIEDYGQILLHASFLSEIATVFQEIHDEYSIDTTAKVMEIFYVTRNRNHLNRVEIYREVINGK